MDQPVPDSELYIYNKSVLCDLVVKLFLGTQIDDIYQMYLSK